MLIQKYAHFYVNLYSNINLGTTNVVRVVSAAGPDVWFDEDGNLKDVQDFQ